jgi:acyl-CoA reductase-like NAD-dependent aldehyde dehydrogenase
VAIAPRSGVDDVGRAAAAARATFDEGVWPATSGRERAAILFELAQLLREEAEPLARLVATEMGKPVRYVREREIAPAIDRILFYASAARMIRGEVTASAPSHLLNFILKAGRRVRPHHAVERPGRPAVARSARRSRPAAPSCSSRPATPASSMAIFRPRPADALPRGVANGSSGRATSSGGARDRPAVDKISFTGSSESGGG